MAGFTPATARRIVRATRHVEQSLASRKPAPASQPGFTGVQVYIAKTPSDGIPARDGTTAGSAMCELYQLDGSSELVRWLDSDGDPVSVQVQHLGEAAVAGNAYVRVAQELLSGLYIADPGSSGTSPERATWFRTQEAWRKNSGDARVNARRITGTPGRTSTSTDETDVWIYLPRTRPADPNVVASTNILCGQDSDNAWTCLSDYLDDKIGTVKMWVGAKAAIPSGWRLMDGVENAIGNGGTGFSFTASANRFPRATTEQEDVGLAGGESQVTVEAHEAVDVVACIADHAAKNTDSGGAISGSTGSAGSHAHAGSSVGADGGHDHAGQTGDSGAHSHGGETGSAGDHGHTVNADIDGAHTHTVTISGAGAHDHDLTAAASSGTTGSGQANLNDPGHTHTIPATGIFNLADGDYTTQEFALHYTNSAATGITDQGHTHSIGSHTHTVTAGDDGGHSHSATVSGTGAHFHHITVSDASAHVHTITAEEDHHHSIGSVTDHTHQLSIATDGAHTHGVTVSAHVHGITLYTHAATDAYLSHEPIDIIPPYLYVMFIERVDNSAGN